MSFQKTIRHNTMKEKVLLFEMGQYEQRGLIQNCFPVEHKFTGFKITLISFSYVCLPFYLVFRTCYRWLFSDHQFFPLGDSFCPRLPSFHPSQYISSSSLWLWLWIAQTIPSLDNHWWGRAWQQWSVAASHKASWLRSLLLTSQSLGCSQLFALKPRNASSNPEHSCYPSMQTKQAKRSLNNTTFEKS